MKTKYHAVLAAVIVLCNLGATGIALAVATTYYSQGNLPVNLTSSWNTQANGSGSAPTDFTSDVYYVIQSGHTMTTTASWSVTTTTPRSITVNSGGGLTLSHGVTITSQVTFIVNGSLDCGTSTIGGSGATTVNSSATVNIRHADGLAGNIFTLGSNSFSPGATYVYNGSVGQAISSYLPNNLTGTLKIDNSNGVSVNRSLTITSGTLDLTSGVLKTRFDISTIQNLSIGSAATLSNYSSNSFVDGPLIATLSSGVGRTFPIGSGATYRPISLNMSVGQDVTAEMFNSAPSGSLTGSGVNKISSVRYYSISHAASSNCTVTLSWASDDGVSDLTNITAVYGANTTVWLSNSRSGSTTGNTTSGTVTGTFSNITGADFTLGNIIGGTNSLPVEMTSFTAFGRFQRVELAWRTASEVNNYGFEIERSRGAAQWQRLGFVGGVGTSSTPNEYTFADDNLRSGKYSYRLKQIDRNGVFCYSPTVEVFVSGAPTGFILAQNYPNPFNPTTLIDFQIAQQSFVTLKISDLLGREVATLVNERKDPGAYSVTFDATGLPGGVYLYRLQAGDLNETKKLVMLR